MKQKKGQSAIEYILLAACFIAFLIVFLAPNGPMKNTIELNINRSVDQIGAMVNITDFSSGLIPEPVTTGNNGNGNPGGVDCTQATQGICGVSSGFENCYQFIMRKYQGYCVDVYQGCYANGGATGYNTYCTGHICRCTEDSTICPPQNGIPACQ